MPDEEEEEKKEKEPGASRCLAALRLCGSPFVRLASWPPECRLLLQNTRRPCGALAPLLGGAQRG